MKLKDIINNPDNYELEEHTDGAYLIRAKKEDKGDTPEAGKLYVLEEDHLHNNGHKGYVGDVYYHNGSIVVSPMINLVTVGSQRRVYSKDRWRCIGTIEELMKKVEPIESRIVEDLFREETGMSAISCQEALKVLADIGLVKPIPPTNNTE